MDNRGRNWGVKVTKIFFSGYAPLRVQCLGDRGVNWGVKVMGRVFFFKFLPVGVKLSRKISCKIA